MLQTLTGKTLVMKYILNLHCPFKAYLVEMPVNDLGNVIQYKDAILRV